ncbi:MULTISPECIES: hypothetical protein [Halalkalibacter]|jgi:hypothetical protein|uniref:Uncharacterized protein n=1 Tax=Halalkalibacter alkaliphilus TaxID=2917993 RepID=A0A9X1ZYD4_9BACI|nr:hypothetical protein [Halalkalibacter alkaliphilus]MCL7746616.1 hypothetical protein [Halalkalibacter alkaliphilus]
MVHWKITATLRNGDYVLQYGSSESEEKAYEEMKQEELLIRQQYSDNVKEMDYWL